MYRVFEALDEVVTIIEEARGVPMTANCIVPKGDVLELLDDVRDNIPAEIDDAQDVLDKRDEIVATATNESERAVSKAHAEAEEKLNTAQAEAERILTEAHLEADHLVQNARAEAEQIVGAGRAEYESLVGGAHAEAQRLTSAGQASYEQAVDDGRKEQARLVSQTEVVSSAHAESARLIDGAHAEVDQVRGECDVYVDTKLAEFEDLLSHTLRTIGNGRSHLRPQSYGQQQPPASKVPFDYTA